MEKDRRCICDILCNGLARLEYRGYDSAGEPIPLSALTLGIGIDGDSPDSPILRFKEVGKVAALRKHIAAANGSPNAVPVNGSVDPTDASEAADGVAPLPSDANGNSVVMEDGVIKAVDMSRVFLTSTSIAHTRWATHGVPSPLNCHPHVSDHRAEFSLVHNGIITNHKELKTVLQKRGYRFETDTDTEAVAVLCKYVWDSQPNKRLNFTELIKTVIKELASTSRVPR